MKMNDNQFLSGMQLQQAFFEGANANSNVRVSHELGTNGPSFETIFNQKVHEDQGVKFSKHASMRLENRNISLSNEQISRLNKGTLQAGDKGIKDSLVLMDQLAFIVNVPTKTVITAMDQNDTNNNIFTNIDGAVIC